nr:lipocalin-like domain-containing protein [Hydrogenophaga sp.]
MNNAQPKVPELAPLLGQWSLISFDLESQQSGERRPAWGSGPVGRLVILPSAFMIVVLTAANRAIPTTNDQRAEAFMQTIAYTGPIEVEGDLMKTKVDVSWNEAWTSTVQTRAFKFIGQNLSLISTWAPSPFDPSVIVRGILEWKREA